MRLVQFASPVKKGGRRGPDTDKQDASASLVGEPYLPPLVRLQGPFKPPEEVRRLKSKLPNPTLRVATEYGSEDLKRQALYKLSVIRQTPLISTYPLLGYAKVTPYM
jgi:hypothetical protein